MLCDHVYFSLSSWQLQPARAVQETTPIHCPSYLNRPRRWHLQTLQRPRLRPPPSTTATVASTTTTIAETTEVLSVADSEAQAIQELPLTGGESQAAFIALLMLALGGWLVRRANVAQSIIDRIRANLTRP